MFLLFDVYLVSVEHSFIGKSRNIMIFLCNYVKFTICSGRGGGHFLGNFRVRGLTKAVRCGIIA